MFYTKGLGEGICRTCTWSIITIIITISITGVVCVLIPHRFVFNTQTLKHRTAIKKCFTCVSVRFFLLSRTTAGDTVFLDSRRS